MQLLCIKEVYIYSSYKYFFLLFCNKIVVTDFSLGPGGKYESSI